MACELTDINNGIRTLRNSGSGNTVATKAEIAKLETAKELFISATIEVAALTALDNGQSVRSAITNAIESSPGYIELTEKLFNIDNDVDKLTAVQARSYANKVAQDYRTKIQSKTSQVEKLDVTIAEENGKIADARKEPSKESDMVITRATKYLDKLQKWRSEAIAERKGAKQRDTREKNAVVKLNAAKDARGIITEQISQYTKQFAANVSLLDNTVTTTSNKGTKTSAKFSKYFDVKPTYNILQLITGDSTTVFEEATELRSNNVAVVDVGPAQRWMDFTEGYITKYFAKKATTVVDNYDIGPSDKFESYQHISKLIQVQNADGSFALTPKTVTIMAAAINDYLVGMSDNRWASRTDDDINRFLGRPKGSPVSPNDYNALKGVDTFQRTAANIIGSKIAKDLGITTNDFDISPILFDKLKVELGLVAVDSMEAAGIVNTTTRGVSEIYSDSDSANTVMTMEITPKIGERLDARDKSYHKAVNTINEILAVDSNVKAPRFSKKADTYHENRSAQGKFFTTASETNDILNKATNTPFKMDDEFIGAIEQVLDEDEKLLLDALGFKDTTAVHAINLKSVESNNQAIIRNVNNLIATSEGMKADNVVDMFFNYFFGKNGRLYLDSSTFNPQNTLLHRFSVYPGENTIKTASEYDLYKLTLGQAFGLDVDKFTVEKSLKDWAEVEKVLDGLIKPSDDLTTVLRKVKEYNANTSNKPIKGHAPEHLLAGLVEYSKYKAHITRNGGLGDGFISHLPLEIDAVTSGYILKTLQMPLIDDYETHLESGGVMFKDKEGNWNYDSFGEQYESAKTLDSYEKPAKVMITKLQAATQAWTADGNVQLTEAASLALGMDVNTINPNDKDTKKKLRNFMKPPFMVFNYGAGMEAIIGTVVDVAIDNFYNLVTESSGLNGPGEEASSSVETLIKSANTRYKVTDGVVSNNGKNYDGLVEAELARFNSDKFKGEGRLKFELHPDLLANLRSGVSAGIGQELKTVFNETYKANMQASKTMNKAFTGMFRMFKVRLDKSIKDKQEELGRDLTNGEYDVLVELLKDDLPAVKVALAVADTDKLMIFEEGQVDYDGSLNNLNVTGQGKYRNGKGDHSKFRSAYAKKYELIEAIAAGAVIPIHYIDGSLVTRALANTDALNIFDAFMTLPLEAQKVAKDYNMAVGELSADYNLAYEVAAEFYSTISTMTKGELAEVNAIYTKEYKGEDPKKAPTIDGAYKAMQRLADKVSKERDKLYAKDMRIEHLAMPGGHYDRKGTATSDVTTSAKDANEFTSTMDQDSATMSDTKDLDIEGLDTKTVDDNVNIVQSSTEDC